VALALAALVALLLRGSAAPARALTAGAVLLPDGRSVVARDVAGAHGLTASLFVASARGGKEERITYFDRGRDVPLAVLDDGRVAFRHDDGASHVMTIEPDGTGLAAYDGTLPPATSGRRPQIATSLVDREKTRGRALCLDAGLTGRREGVRPARVRVRDANGVLGETDVLADGSFLLDLPADRAIRLETVDADGRTLAAMSSTFWVRPNETRGCIGCHEAAETAPENRRPLAVRGEAVVIAGHGGGARP
jgi:hypothetical protein